MSPRNAFMQLITKAAIGFGALFLVGVVLAAIPNHRPPMMAETSADPAAIVQQAQEQGQAIDHSKMPGMSMDMDDAKTNEAAATHDMAHMHHGDNPHMHMTSPRPQTAADVQRAEEIVKELRAGIAKYKDYHVALNEGYKIFLPNVPQPEYHFTNYGHGFLEAFTFDPGRPTSLLYKKTADGYELVGAMYTMPKRANEEQLNDRVPLSVATWLAYEFMYATARPAKDCGLHEVWAARVDHHARGVRCGRRQISSGDFRLDGARVSLRRFDGQDFRDASSRLTAERRTSRSSPHKKISRFFFHSRKIVLLSR